ncbi:hypothetical protein [Prosthecobacter sp.]|uniref:hypothetical protein n=1 Tax=Prosthecobacter sp. TaxID=1965333 RepID=UPI0037830BAE
MSTDYFQKGNMNPRGRPVLLGSGISAFGYAGSGTKIVSVRPMTNFVKSDNWQYNKR